MIKEDSGPAFPKTMITQSDELLSSPEAYSIGGMTLRTYAAIKLRQPDSGIDWLDAMIRKARRDELAKAALTGICVSDNFVSGKLVSVNAYEVADAMIAESEKP